MFIYFLFFGIQRLFWYKTSVSTNIQLDVSDQDGDALIYTIVDPPSNGTAVITETQGGGVLTYTSNAGFEGTETFTYKANDGTSDSNIGTISINVFEKDAALNWATHYAGQDWLKDQLNSSGLDIKIKQPPQGHIQKTIVFNAKN